MAELIWESQVNVMDNANFSCAPKGRASYWCFLFGGFLK